MAQVNGFVGTLDVIVYPVQQTGELTQNFDSEVVKNSIGFDVSETAKNELHEGDMMFMLLGDTNAHAKSGAQFLAPLATVVFTGSDSAAYNGTYINRSGAAISLKNTGTGEIKFKLRKYADADQNTLMTSAPA